jgi:hypothetical protein
MIHSVLGENHLVPATDSQLRSPPESRCPGQRHGSRHSHYDQSLPPWPRRERCSKVAQQYDGLSDLVIRLQQEHGVNCPWQRRVIRPAQYRFDVAQVLFANSRFNVTYGLRIDIDGVHGSSIPRLAARTVNQPDPAPIPVTVLPGAIPRMSMTRLICSLSSLPGESDGKVASVRLTVFTLFGLLCRCIL